MIEIDELQVGSELANGARVALHHQHRDGAVVLAQKQDGEWVTWDLDVFGNAHWGHYFRNDQLAAAADFVKRVLNHQ